MTARPYDARGREVRAGDTIGFCGYQDSVLARSVAGYPALVTAVRDRGGITFRSKMDGKERRLGRKSVARFVVGRV